MEDRITVVFFSRNSSVLGGGLTMLFRLIDNIDESIFRPIIIVPEKSEVYHKANELGVETRVIPFKGILNKYDRKILEESSIIEKTIIPLRVLQYNSNIRDVFSEADLVWCHGLRMVLTVLPNSISSQTPTIWNIGLGYHSEGITKYLNSLALRSVDHVFIESETQACRLFTERQYTRHKKKFTIFHKGIDVEYFEPSQFETTSGKESVTIGTAASLMPRKGIEYLIDAMPAVLEENDRVLLKIAGDTPEGEDEYLTQLRSQVRQHGLEEHVEFLGWIEDMPRYYSTLDIFILPSLNEGIPGVVREALAMEVPVVATDVAGTSEAVIHDETGLLVNPEDPDQLSSSILYLINNPEEASRLAKNGREHMVNSFSIRNYIDDYESFLEKIHMCEY